MTALLAIDTASDRFAVAWESPEGAIEAFEAEDPREHSRQLLDAINKVSGGGLVEATAILVTTGPGSYAGLRVGIATAEGLALARQAPVYGVGTLEAAARAGETDGAWTVIHPIGRGEFVVQEWRGGAPAGDIEVAQAAGLAGRRLKGEGAGPRGGIEVSPCERCLAAIVLRRDAILSGEARPGAEAFYIREPHITRPRKASAGRVA